MGSSGTMADFLGSHPQYANQLQGVNGSKDVFNLPTGERLDLVGDVGGANRHNWNGTGVNAQGIPDQPAGGGGGGLPAAFGSVADYMGSKSGTGGFGDLKGTLSSLLNSGGNFNQAAVNRRVSNAADTLNRNRQSQLRTNQAMLADRGLIGSGPEASAMTSLESLLGDTYNTAVNDIYANESQQADQRLMTALQIAAGLTTQEAQQAIDWFKAQADLSLGQGQLALGNRNADITNTLGLGNLALGNSQNANNYALGQGRLDLDWASLDQATKNQLLDQYLNAANQARSGNIG
jgi:hypothetical protein